MQLDNIIASGVSKLTVIVHIFLYSTSVSVTSRSCLARVCSLDCEPSLISVALTSTSSLTISRKSTSSSPALECSRVAPQE